MGRPYRPSASVHAAFRSKSITMKKKKAERAKFESTGTINQVRARRQAIRKASEIARLRTYEALAPSKLQLIVDGVVVSQTTQSPIIELPPSPGNDIGYTEDFATFDFEGPDNCCVDASTTVDCGTAPAGTATAPVDFVPAMKVDCGSAPVTAVAAAPAQTDMLFGNTQVDTTFNARAFAMSLKRGEQRKYEGVSAAEETTIPCAQFRTTANIKSKLQVANAFYGCLASTKRYHELGIKQKNPFYDPSDPYTFVPEFEYGFIIVCIGEKTEWKWLIVTRCITQFLILYKQKLHKAVLKRLKEEGVPDSSIWAFI
jgi:hypothetical protein